ncbi:MAG: hypothetical protein ABL888_13880 [Pirellulaceae bacterium]
MAKTRFSIRSLFVLITVAAFFFSALVAFFRGSAWGGSVWIASAILIFVHLLGTSVYWTAVTIGLIGAKPSRSDTPRDVV